VDKRKGKGLSKEEQIYLLMNDISECMDYLDDYAFYQCLDGVRQGVLIEMCFNLGLNGLLGFRNMIAAINKKDYASATIEMRGSRWASQIGSSRLENLCFRMRNGDYP
jgi:lysozyme